MSARACAPRPLHLAHTPITPPHPLWSCCGPAAAGCRLNNSVATGVTDRAASLWFAMAVLSFTPSYTAAVAWDRERLLLRRESSQGLYSVTAWFAAKTATTTPVEICQTTVFCIIMWVLFCIIMWVLCVCRGREGRASGAQPWDVTRHCFCRYFMVGYVNRFINVIVFIAGEAGARN